MIKKRRVVVEEEEEGKFNERCSESETTKPNNSSSDESEEDCENRDTNAGWVDSISKILRSGKPKGKKTLVLSKAKKLAEVQAKKAASPAGFQIESKDGVVKEEEIERAADSGEKREPKRKRKQEVVSVRVKPDVLERNREKVLSKIATKGVVQLFNSVRLQQKDIVKKVEDAGPLEVKRDKALKSIDKRAFLDVLMGEKSQPVDERASEAAVKDDKAVWNVLRDDFMMGGKLRDWDKEMEVETEVT